MSCEADDLAMLRARWDLQCGSRAVNRTDRDRSTESSLCECDWLDPDEVVCFAFEVIVFLHTYDDMKVARRSRAIRALLGRGRFAFALNANNLSVSNALWDLHFDGS